MRPSDTNRLPNLCWLFLGLLMLGWPLQGAEFNAPTPLQVNAARLQKRIEKLGRIGGASKGITRLAFTDADLRGRAYVTQLMREANLEVRVDNAGNLLGHQPGRSPGIAPIVLGSHIDTVPLAGAYDGVLGVMAAIECIQVLGEHGIRTQHPLEVIVFANEEGGLTGSRALAGRLNAQALEESSRGGISVRQGLAALGGNAEQIFQVIRRPGEVKAYLELHIEQGGNLESEGADIGIVEGFVGIRWWDVTVMGFANHAGTTPMNARQDALLAAAKLVIAVNQAAKSLPGRQVATVGRITSEPGAPNVIPGRVKLSLELRDLAKTKLDKVFQKIRRRAELIGQETNTQIKFKEIDIGVEPSFTDPNLQEVIRQTAEAMGLSYTRLPSGAAHDAQNMSQIAPSAMIFVPSMGGISHSPQEYTRPQDIVNGANLLLQTLIQVDWQAAP